MIGNHFGQGVHASELFKDFPGKSESIQNCKATWTYHADGPITYITLEQHWIASLLPMLVCSLEEASGNWVRQSCFFTAVDPLHEPRVDPPYTTDQPRMVPYTNRRRPQDAVYWFDLKMAQEKGLHWYFGQTISNAIILNNSMPADCLVKVVKRNHEVRLHQRTQRITGYTKGVVQRATWRQDQLSSEEPEACCLKLGPSNPGETQPNPNDVGTPNRHSISVSAPSRIRSGRKSEEIDLRYCASDSYRS